MVVLVLERVPVGLRGELTRWMIELRSGVFVGNISAMVRDHLWEKVSLNTRGGAGILAYSADNEQGYKVEYWGEPTREIVDFEGLSLVRTRP